MQSKVTFKIKEALKYVCLLCVLGFSFGSTLAQGSLATTYSLGSGIARAGGDKGITFVIENTNATPRVLTQIDMSYSTNIAVGATTATLWYSATDLSGKGAGIVSPTWTQIATNPNINITTSGIFPTFTGLTFVIPANTQYRFAIESSNGINYGGASSTPNNFTADGIILKTGSAQIAGANVGYAINPMPTLLNNPRFFGGKIYWALPTTCSGAPTPGNAVSTLATVCPTDKFTLSTSTPAAAGTLGLTYQWQSATAATGPWTDISGATSSTFLTSQSAATFYRLAVTCSGTTTNSTATQVTMKTLCYCGAGVDNFLYPFAENIGVVQLGTINNNTSSSVDGYADYTAISTTLERQSVTPLTISGNGNTYSGDVVSVWIDFNHDGDFTDPGENVYVSTAGAGPYTSNITIPSTAATGVTTMRIRMFDSFNSNGNDGPCGYEDTYGEVEDYSINITPCVTLTPTTQPSSVTTSCGSNVSFTFPGYGSGVFYDWQVSTDAGVTYTDIADGGVYTGATTNTLTITNAPIIMNGYLYKLAYRGGCTPESVTTPAKLTVTTLIGTVSPASASICAGSIQQLSITNTAPPTKATFCSGPVNLAIPDGSFATAAVCDAGVNSSIPVTIPSGVAVVSMNVKFNIDHTYIGDLVIVLKAPNGKILNLVYHKSGTGGTSGGKNFTNTVISSAGTVPISSGTAPFTSIFKADASIGAGSYGDNQGSGPTGFSPDVTSWDPLYSTLSGNWTIAVADPAGWTGDVGILKDWCIELNYGAPSTGIYKGTAGTIFTDAAGTTPYDGTTPINTVYVKPAVTTNYSVVVTTATCVSSSTSIPVTVNNPITDSRITVANAETCNGNNASFTATAATGNGVQHQWQVSTDNGTSFTNVSGATNSTFTITGATVDMNNNKYRDSLYVTSCGNYKISDVATLKVNPTPVITLSAAPYTSLTPGLTTTITASVSPNAGATYTWFRNGVVVPGVTGNKIVVNIDQLGDYSANVNDIKSCNGSTTNSVTISSTPNSNFYLYPSPTTGIFQVRYFSTDLYSNVPGIINVFDSKGNRVFSKTYSLIQNGYNKMEVNLTGFSKGIYRVDLMDTKGNRIKTGSVLVL